MKTCHTILGVALAVAGTLVAVEAQARGGGGGRSGGGHSSGRSASAFSSHVNRPSYGPSASNANSSRGQNFRQASFNNSASKFSPPTNINPVGFGQSSKFNAAGGKGLANTLSLNKGLGSKSGKNISKTGSGKDSKKKDRHDKHHRNWRFGWGACDDGGCDDGSCGDPSYYSPCYTDGSDCAAPAVTDGDPQPIVPDGDPVPAVTDANAE